MNGCLFIESGTTNWSDCAFMNERGMLPIGKLLVHMMKHEDLDKVYEDSDKVYG
jgi:hypothetical protein